MLSTNITSDLDKIGDKIILIDEGKVLKEAPKQEFLMGELNVETAMMKIISRKGIE